MKSLFEESLSYHSNPPGKMSTCHKPLGKNEMRLAYTPGVAEVCKLIQEDPSQAPFYTNINNRALVISDGSATLGLGDTGPLPSKPVMEGKAALMSRLAGIDAVDLVCKPQELLQVVRSIACNFGLIHLEDIAAPRCFEITDLLSQELEVPVFHDDQSGTAVVVAATLKKALGRRLDSVKKLVISGAGAAAQAVANLLIHMGLRRSAIWMFDSKGLLTEDRDLDRHKSQFARKDPDCSYKEALSGAEIFIGCSRGGLLKPEEIKEMAARPLILALANPLPEINVVEAEKLRPDGIFYTGEMVNNLSCFPFLIRGALDVGASKITQEMLVACTEALCEIDGPPLDWRLPFCLAPAVAEAAMKCGVARRPINDLEAYRWQMLFNFLGVRRRLPSKPFPQELPLRKSREGFSEYRVYRYQRWRPPVCSFSLDELDEREEYLIYGKKGEWQVLDGSDMGLLLSCTAFQPGHEKNLP